MKILLDHQIFTEQNYGGISQYFTELSRRLGCDIPRYVSTNEYYRTIQRPLPSIYRGVGAYYLNHAVNGAISLRALRRGNFDIFHPTYYSPYFLRAIGDKPYVLTVSDMIHELYPKVLRDSKSIIRNKKLLIDRAAHIITPTENTKRDLCRIYGTDPGMITVTPLGTSIRPTKGTLTGLPERYILYVGNRERYKGFQEFIDAVGLFADKDPTIHIVCAGGGPFTGSEREMIDNNPSIKYRVHQAALTAENISCLYQQARLFVFPSWYEGFGIPLLESMACGCPIVCTDTPAFREVAGNAALFFKNADPCAMYETMTAALYDGERESLIKRGRQRIGQYSWQRTADLTNRVYAAVLGET